MASEWAFYPVVAATLARQIGSALDFVSMWRESISPKQNMDLFMRALLEEAPGPLCWFIDAADRLFEAGYSSEFYGLVRSWHNSRATGRRGPWDRLTVVIGYATDPHLFIQDLHQSPFNVGKSVALSPFSLDQTNELNVRYGAPLRPDQAESLFALVGGHPFLTRHALDLTSRGEMVFDRLLEQALSGDGPFGGHLKRLLLSVTSLPQVRETLLRSLSEPQLAHTDGLHRLVAGGVLVQTAPNRYELPSKLYRDYLSRELLL
jgi:AAA domain-containing protein